MGGKKQDAIDVLKIVQQKLDRMNINSLNIVTPELVLAYLRLGERSNLITHHSSETCIFPIRGAGIYISIK